jgi:hypothetical protein
MQGYYFSRPLPARDFEQLLIEGRGLAPEEMLAPEADALPA